MAGNKNSGRKGKTLQEHLRDGTFSASRHGHLMKSRPLLQRIEDALGPKPTDPVKGGKRASRKWVTSEADEHALANGHRFNEPLAEYVVKFFERFLCFSAGKWAGKPFILNEFQQRELIYPLFGWVRSDGTRRFRTSYIEWPKKNYKSETAAGIGLYALCGDGEAGAEVYSLGADKDQARVVHNVAIVMTESSPELKEALNINRTTGNIAFPESNSFYRALSAAPKGKHGLKAHFGIADELHEWSGRTLWDSMRYAYRMRSQPLQFVITNAGDDIASVCFEQRQKAERVISGEVYDDRFFASIKSVTEKDARAEIHAVARGATEIPVATSCNPAMGDVINPVDFIQDIKDAIETPGEMPNLLRLSYGVWATGSDKTLLDSPDDWDQCIGDFSDDDLMGRPCAAGLDLARHDDITALSLWFPGFGEFKDRVACWFWASHDSVHSPKQKYGDLLRGFADDPRCRFTLTPGNVTDYGEIVSTIYEMANTYDIQCLCFDPHFATETAQAVSQGLKNSAGEIIKDGTGIACVDFRQTMTMYAESTEKFCRLVKSHDLEHEDNPMLNWMVKHCSYLEDREGRRRPVKPGSAHDPRKVDGVQASIMALHGAMFEMSTDGHSAYAESGGGVVLF